MSNQQRTNQGRPAASAKKEYKKPEFQREKVFETMALSCGKVESTQGACHFNRKNS
jgi:hypothetical protein